MDLEFAHCQRVQLIAFTINDQGGASTFFALSFIGNISDKEIDSFGYLESSFYGEMYDSTSNFRHPQLIEQGRGSKKNWNLNI